MSYQEIEKQFYAKGINDPVAVAWHVITLVSWRLNGDWVEFMVAPDPDFYLDQIIYPWTRAITGLDWLSRPAGVDFRSVSALVADLPMPTNRDTLGDIYEAALSHFGTAGKVGLFRTPFHIARFMADLGQPQSGELVCDPAVGTGSLLLAGADSGCMPVGGDLGAEMVALARLNLHRFGARLHVRDFLIDSSDDLPSLYLVNPPFNAVNGDGNTEEMFLERLLDTMPPDSRLVILLPNGILFKRQIMGLRQRLLTDFDLQAVISLPGGVFKPYTGVVTSILVIQNHAPKSEMVYFSQIEADGFSLDSRRRPIAANDLPDVLNAALQWINYGQSTDDKRVWLAAKEEIAANEYNLTGNRYKPFVLECADLPPLADTIRAIQKDSQAIMAGLDRLASMLEQSD